jgi:hypothetical protein
MSLTVEDYSERAIVVRGNTQPHKDRFSEIGGKWNSMLKGGAGWIFPKSKQSIVEGLIEKLESTPTPSVSQHSQSALKSTSSTSSNIVDKRYVLVSDYLQLLSRVERLEQVVANKPIASRSTVRDDSPSVEEDEDDEPEEKVERMLKRR